MKKYSDQDMLKIISEIETTFAESLNKAEVQVKADEELVKSESELDYDDEDFAEMEKMYKSMNKKEAEAHYKSLKKALFGEEEKEEEKKEEKKEDKKDKKESKKEKEEEVEKCGEMTKSETPVSTEDSEKVKAENAELKKSIEQYSKVLELVKNKVLVAPKQKAITNLDYVKKSEEEKAEEKTLSKNEVIAKLAIKARDINLNKSDREAINNYCVNNASIDSIKHLL
jgi:DNA mismatch repair ATPase MutL